MSLKMSCAQLPMETAKKVIDVALGMRMWVFGGYVRDVTVRGQKKFKDLDLCCPRGTNPKDFLRVLRVHHKVSHVRTNPMSGYACMSFKIEQLFRCVVDDTLDVEIVVYDGTIREWQNEHTADFSCNLFYQSRDVQLGIRYVPEFLEHEPNPVRTLVEMTQQGIFYRIWDGTSVGCIRKIVARAHTIVVHRKMTLRGQLISGKMFAALSDSQYIKEICDQTEESIQQFQEDRSITEFFKCLKRMDIHLPDGIKQRIVGDPLAIQ